MSQTIEAKQASFTRMDQSTAEDWTIIKEHVQEFSKGLADRILDHMRLLADDYGGFKVTRLEHCLQTATMAHKAGKDEEYVVCALLHDIGDTLGTFNHSEVAATILEPFVSEENHWIIKHHGIFQGYYYFHLVGMDRDMREKYRDHPFFEACEQFCKFDQAAFDPDYNSMSLDDFAPMVRRVFASPKKSMYKEALQES